MRGDWTLGGKRARGRRAKLPWWPSKAPIRHGGMKSPFCRQLCYTEATADRKIGSTRSPPLFFFASILLRSFARAETIFEIETTSKDLSLWWVWRNGIVFFPTMGFPFGFRFVARVAMCRKLNRQSGIGVKRIRNILLY